MRERGEELDIVYRDLQRDIAQVEKRLLLEIKSLKSSLDTRVSLLEKWRWLIIGGALAIGFILAQNMPKSSIQQVGSNLTTQPDLTFCEYYYILTQVLCQIM